MFGTIYPPLMLISNRFVLVKRFLSNIDLSAYLHKLGTYQSDAPWCQLKPFRIILHVVVHAMLYFVTC